MVTASAQASLEAVDVGVQMGRAADTVPGELWAGLAQVVDAAGAKAILPGQLLGFLLEQLDRAASGNMPRGASSISRLFATQADEASSSLSRSHRLGTCYCL